MDLGDLDTYRTGAQAFARDLGREHYLHFAGLQPRYEPAAVYAAHAQLFDDRAFAALQAAGEPARRLLAFCVDGRLTQATAPMDAERAARESALRVVVDGMVLSLWESLAVQAADPDRDRRERVEEARLRALEAELAPLARDAAAAAQATARELGWPSLTDLWADIRGIDLQALSIEAAEFVGATKRAYEPAADAALRLTAEVGLDDARRSDLSAFFRQAWASDYFAGDRAADSLRATARDLGLDLGRVAFDDSPRPTKSARAFCAAVHVPDEVHLVVAPAGSVHQFTAVMHEGGHALDFAHTDPGLPFEARHLGDPACGEAFAFLFEGLVFDRDWRLRRLGNEGPDGHLAVHDRATRLLAVRRHAALLAYEIHAHGTDGAGASDYSARMTESIGITWPEAAWARDADVRFTTVSYLRGWALSAQLRKYLRERFGPQWFGEREAGATLRDWWHEGRRADAGDLAREVTGAELSFDALAEELGASGASFS